jgi:hypothetical protein
MGAQQDVIQCRLMALLLTDNSKSNGTAGRSSVNVDTRALELLWRVSESPSFSGDDVGVKAGRRGLASITFCDESLSKKMKMKMGKEPPAGEWTVRPAAVPRLQLLCWRKGPP